MSDDPRDPETAGPLGGAVTGQLAQQVVPEARGGTWGGLPQPPMPDRIGRYSLLRRLGEGGMGVVYEAEQESPRRMVAVKVVRGGVFVDEGTVRLFKREADALARLRHPGIASIYESGRTEDGRHFFAMELVQGQSLDAYLAKRGPAASREEVCFRLALFRKITDAVHYAHQRGVIHRDLKPSNILVTEESTPEASASGTGDTLRSKGLPEIKILDFGLARITEADVAATAVSTEIGEIRGTLAYMSPEQTRGIPEEIDLRTDVYTLGVILYEMLAGQRPYAPERAALMEALRVICEEKPTSLRERVRRLDPDVETIVQKALEKEAERRYPSAAALSEDVARYLTSQPILARPPSAVYQLRKFAARNRVLVGGIAATFVMLVAGVAVATLFALGEAAQRRQAEQARSDLESVVEFQSEMLSKVDPEAVGRRLMADLRKRVVQARTDRRASAAEIEAAETAFASAMQGTNPTSSALRLLDEEILARAAQTVEQRFEGRALIAARLRDTIGQTYYVLGLYAPAEGQLRQAVELRQKLLGVDNPQTLLSMKHLGFLLWSRGRYGEAETLAGRTLALHKRVLGESHPETLSSAYCLALVYSGLDRNTEAERLYKETLDAQKRVLGEDHPDTINSMSSLGVLYQDEGRLTEAEELYKTVLSLRRRVLGPEDTQTLSAMNSLAVASALRGRYQEAASLLAETLAVKRRLAGEEHPGTLSLMNNLAALYDVLRRYEEAESLFSRALDIRLRVLGPEHPETLSSMNNLSGLYSRLGRREEALRLSRETLAIRRRVFGPDHSDTLVSMMNLGVQYRTFGRYQEAEPLLREALERRKRVTGPAHPDTDMVRTNLMTLYEAQGRTADLLPLAAEKLEILRVSAEREGATAGEINNYAWQLLTAVPPTLRNPVRALQLAQHACAQEEAGGGPELWNFLDTMALAWQMNGNLAAAAETERKALALLAANRPERAGMLQQLADYEARLAEQERAGSRQPKKAPAGKEQAPRQVS